MAASSAHDRAPVIVSTPATAQATSNHPGDPTSFDESAETRKIPDPIIDPITIIVASKTLRPRTKCSLWADFAVWAGADADGIGGAPFEWRGRYFNCPETSMNIWVS